MSECYHYKDSNCTRTNKKMCPYINSAYRGNLCPDFLDETHVIKYKPSPEPQVPACPYCKRHELKEDMRENGIDGNDQLWIVVVYYCPVCEKWVQLLLKNGAWSDITIKS